MISGRLGAEPEPKAFYAQLTQDEAFRTPLSWTDPVPGLGRPDRRRRPVLGPWPAGGCDPATARWRWPGPSTRAPADRHAFVVQDGQYLSARWPGDSYLFARRFHDLLTTADAG